MKTIAKSIMSFIFSKNISIFAIGFLSLSVATAQSSYSAPSGTFACLINANYSGYNNKTSKSSDAQTVNALLVFEFSATVPNTGNLVASVMNNVIDFERSNPTTKTSTALPYPVAFKLTQITAAKNVYKLVSDTNGDVPYYIAVVNSGNTLLFMSAPSSDKVHNGACQKV
jgi:hypothetical protein